METPAVKQNSRERIPGETLTVADRKEAVVGIPVVVEPIEVEVALGVALVEVRHIAVAVDLADGAL